MTATLPLRRAEARTWWFGYAAIVGIGLLVGLFARRRFTQPYLGLSLALIAVLLVGWIVIPRATLYVTLALAAVSDLVTVSWFPFLKNLSSRESISFVADALTISPVDLTLLTGAVISVARRYSRTRRAVAPSPLNLPMLCFAVFVVYGFARGLSLGADSRIAVLVGRPLLYIPLTYLIAVNELTEPRHRRIGVTAIIVGVFVQSLLSIEFLNRLDPAVREDLESLNEHGSALGQNVVIVALVTMLLFGVKHRRTRWGLVVALAPVGYVFFVAQRRAGVASLVVAGLATAIVLFWKHRRRFWIVVPVATIVLTGYVGAFWNSSSSLGFPAQAVKTVVAPGSATYEDQSSDLYRMIEAYDLNFTIRTNPLLGLGFGQPFYRPIPLPDISFFELNAYQPHNSVLWIWIKFGFGGFVAMLYLVARAIVVGTERARRAPLDLDFVALWTSISFVIMYALYSYVDVSWDARNSVLLGFAIAAVTVAPAPTDPRTVVARGDEGGPADCLGGGDDDRGGGPSDDRRAGGARTGTLRRPEAVGAGADHDGPGTESPVAHTADGTAAAPPREMALLNDGTVEQLSTIPGIGPKLAAAIVEERERHGPFERVTDLDRVSGIGVVRSAVIVSALRG